MGNCKTTQTVDRGYESDDAANIYENRLIMTPKKRSSFEDDSSDDGNYHAKCYAPRRAAI